MMVRIGPVVLSAVLVSVNFAAPAPAGGETATKVATSADEAVPAAWSQWGGPTQDFRAPAKSLAASWPESGPKKLWSRGLGDGYSAILVEDGRLYTMYRTGNHEAVICLDAKTGETVWEYRYAHTLRKEHQSSYGSGPRSTPLIAGDFLFAVGISGEMHALNKNNGDLLWSHELWGEAFGGNLLGHGYSPSPVAYKESVIVSVGGENAGLVAFDQQTGSVKWQAHSFKNGHSSPRIVEIAGEPQLVVFMAEELIGVNPDNGELRWRYPHANQWGHNISMPTIVGGDTIVLSSVQAGARGLRLSHDGEAIKVEEIWSTRKIQFYHASTVRSGDWVYGSTGTMATSFMTGVNIRTGEVAWRERGIARANCVAADGKLVILDEDGMLYLASVTPEKLVIHSKTQLLNRVAWTVPTIVGATMYVRDTRQIIAVDLG